MSSRLFLSPPLLVLTLRQVCVICNVALVHIQQNYYEQSHTHNKKKKKKKIKKKGKPWQEMGFHRPRDVTERRWIHCLLI